MHSQMLQSCLILCDPKDCSLPAPLSMGLSRQEYWSGLPCPPSRDLPEPAIKPASSELQADSLPLSHLGSPIKLSVDNKSVSLGTNDYIWKDIKEYFILNY